MRTRSCDVKKKYILNNNSVFVKLNELEETRENWKKSNYDFFRNFENFVNGFIYFLA